MIQPLAIWRNAAVVTPDDSNDLAHYGTLHVDTGGDLKVLPVDATVAITINVGDDSWVPILVKRVYATGTTATGIVQSLEFE